MSKIVMPKNSAVLTEIKAAMKVYYDENDWLTNDIYTPRLMAIIGGGQDRSAYTKKIQIPSYFGFAVWQDITSNRSPRKLTPLGRKFYEHWCAEDKNGMYDDILTSLETTIFGRNNFGCPDSDSDIEPPILIVRGILDLGYMTKSEMVALLWYLEDSKENYTETIKKIRASRTKYDSSLVEGAPNYYTDNKPITMLVRWGFLKEDEHDNKHIIINPDVKKKYEDRLKKLTIFNVDKVSYLDSNKTNGTDSVTAKVELLEEIPDDITIEELGKILFNMYNNSSSKTTAIHMFGLKYGRVIKKNNYTANAIIEASGLQESYHAEISKGIRIFDSISDNEFGIIFYKKNDKDLKKGDINMLPNLSKRSRNRYALNRILYGAPGTGKTYSTAKYALAIIENKELKEYESENRTEIMTRYNSFIANEQIVFTTFHQSYGYEDFIQGIRPDTSKGTMAFKTVDGVFKIVADAAMNNPDKDYVIIIDEINRANISKVFGELITLIEPDKRWGEENAIAAKLPSGDIFAIPNNLYILGTMNSADKSISLIDTALRRRFEFVEFVPNIKLIKNETLQKVLTKLNEGLERDLDSSDLLIGHSYFIDKSEKDLCDIFNNSIIPLLYEYYYDNTKKVENQINKSIEGIGNLTIDKTSFGRIKLKRNAE